MTQPSFERLEALLATALDLPPDALPDFVERQCAGDPVLRQELLSLIEAHHSAEGYFERLSGDIATGALMEIETAARPKVAIGPYRASAVIGRGGMGVVYRAERIDGQFTQEVAIKLLHLDLQSAPMQARFLAERQLLARLSHPNISRLLDGGVTDEGRAYFVMEFIEGIPITTWCRRRKPRVRAILELYQQVIDAVSYLHSNLVVHRDLKPANILIDGEGRVKLLDFGIAKLLAGDDGAQQTLTSDRLLTPAYAAPEQLAGQPITTAADVYALGAVLYELLAGVKPFAPEAAASNTERGLPAAPSAVVRATARSGGSEPAVAHSWRRLRGDLDAICHMALRPEADRRYASAEQLGEDLTRHLAERPIRASRGTIAYRMTRFARRNRASLAASGLILAALSLGLLQERSLRGEAELANDLARRETAKAKAVSAFLADLLASANPERAQGEDLKVSDLLLEATTRIDGDHALEDQPDVEAALRLTLGRTLTALGQYEEARPHLERAVELRLRWGQSELEKIEASEALGVLQHRAGEYAVAESNLLQVVEARRRLQGDDHPDTLTATANLANLYWYQGRYDEVETLDRRTLEARTRVLGPDHPETLKSLNGLATTLFSRAHFEEAAELFERALIGAVPLLGEHHPDTLRFRNNLAATLSALGRLREAEPVSRAVVEGRTKVLGSEHPNTATAIHNLAIVLTRQAKYQEAEDLLLEAARIRGAKDADNSGALFSRSFLADIYRQTGRNAEALAIYVSVLERQRATLGREHSDALRTASSLAALRMETGELAQARELAEEALESQRRTLGTNHPDTLTTLTILARIHRQAGDLARAEELSSKALEQAVESLSPTHPVILESLEVRTLVLQSQGRIDEAAATAERLLRESTESLGNDHPLARAAARLLDLLRPTHGV